MEKILKIYNTYRVSYGITNSNQAVHLLSDAEIKVAAETTKIENEILKISPNYFNETKKQEIEVQPKEETVKNIKKPNKIKKPIVIWIILIVAIIVGIVLWNINPWYLFMGIGIVVIIVVIALVVIGSAAAINAGRILGNGLSDMDKKHQNEKH